MNCSTRLWRVAVTPAVAVLVLLSTSPSAAAPIGDRHRPSPVQTATVTHTPNGPSTSPTVGAGPFTVTPATTQECHAYFAPTLQLDTSSPRRIHFGGRAYCSYVDTALWLTINLYTIQGNGDNQHLDFEGQWTIPPTVSSAIGQSWSQACIGTTATRWQANLYAGASIGNMQPFPLWGSVYTFACG